MRGKFIYLLGFHFVFFSSFIPSIDAQIPTISIQTENEIVDEPKVHGVFTYTDADGVSFSGDLGIEIRGGFTQTFPKKTYDLEFWTDDSGEDNLDVQFGDLREDDDWVLDALYNEPLRINSFLAHKLWLEMNELYYSAEEPKAKSGADVMYVEVILNNEYQGIYMLSEQVDRSLLKLKKNSGTDIRGELYKGYAWDDAVLFNPPSETPDNNSIVWSGFEYKYPSDIIDWSNVEELVEFVANSSDEDFIQGVSARFDMNNIIEYFIFINLGRFLDNRGKNIYLSRYDADEPYFFTPWDLDGSFGLLWNGSNTPQTDEIMSNNLYDRLLELDVDEIRQTLSDKWNELRADLISNSALENRIIELHQFLTDNNIYEKEEEAWEYVYDEGDLDYTLNWVEGRLDYLDDYFRDITSTELVNASSFIVYPNPVGERLFISGDLNDVESFRIFDVYGRKMKEIYDVSNSIATAGLIPGLYYLQVGEVKVSFFKF